MKHLVKSTKPNPKTNLCSWSTMAFLLNSSPLISELRNTNTTIDSALQSCNSLQQAKQIHAFLLRNEFYHQRLYLSKLLLLYTSHPLPLNGSSAVDYAVLVFEHLQFEPNVFMWNTMIRHYVERKNPFKAVLMYSRMREQGTQPNNYTFNFLIKACTADESLMGFVGRAVHGQSVVFGVLESDVHFYTSLINMYAMGGSMDFAWRVFDRMEKRSAVSWNAMIAGYVKMGDVETAHELFDEMPERDGQSWNVCGCLAAGKSLFEEMPVKTLPTWNAMIAGYMQASRPAEALGLFRQMQLVGVKPDKITVVTVLPACAQLGALELGEWVHFYAKKNKLDANTLVCNAIVDMYAKCGCIDEAMAVFMGMRDRDIVSWNTMLSALAIHGRGEEALDMFSQMVNNGVMPDDVTFVGILNACSHSGLSERAWIYFENMQKVYGMQPKIEHYGCLVDVLGRSKRLNEALDLIDSMPIEPNSVILGSLLNACRLCNNSQLGEKVLEKLVEVVPLNPGYYVLLSNMYASAGKWEEVIQIRKLMKSRGIEKTPGSSSIVLGNAVHEFIVGDKTHPQTQLIYQKLDEIHQKLKSAGYVPDTSIVLFDLDEKEKAHNLLVHSEKLAIAFGLLRTSSKVPIRVVKNLRICVDCHSAIKLISQLYSREIVLRDCSRFHHFRNGCCSCNDFW